MYFLKNVNFSFGQVHPELFGCTTIMSTFPRYFLFSLVNVGKIHFAKKKNPRERKTKNRIFFFFMSSPNKRKVNFSLLCSFSKSAKRLLCFCSVEKGQNQHQISICAPIGEVSPHYLSRWHCDTQEVNLPNRNTGRGKKKLDKKKFYCFFVKVSLNYELSSVDCLFLVVRKRERPSAFCCLCSYWKDLTYLPVLEQQEVFTRPGGLVTN